MFEASILSLYLVGSCLSGFCFAKIIIVILIQKVHYGNALLCDTDIKTGIKDVVFYDLIGVWIICNFIQNKYSLSST